MDGLGGTMTGAGLGFLPFLGRAAAFVASLSFSFSRLLSRSIFPTNSDSRRSRMRTAACILAASASSSSCNFRSRYSSSLIVAVLARGSMSRTSAVSTLIVPAPTGFFSTDRRFMVCFCFFFTFFLFAIGGSSDDDAALLTLTQSSSDPPINPMTPTNPKNWTIAHIVPTIVRRTHIIACIGMPARSHPA